MASLTPPYFGLSADDDVLEIRIPKSPKAVASSLLDAAESWAPSRLAAINRPGLSLVIGLGPDADLVRGYELDRYATALAYRLKEVAGVQFSSLKLKKVHDELTTLAVADSVPIKSPIDSVSVNITTRRSYATPNFGREIHEATESLRQVTDQGKPMRLHLAYVTGLPRTWSNLWEPTIAGIFEESRQIVELSLSHSSVGEQLGHRIQITISASRVPPHSVL